MASETDIPETGAIFTFGRSRFAGNEPSRFWVRNDRILHLACGDEHTALITESGRIFMFGLNEWGQLGLGDTIPRDKPSCIKDLKSEKITLVACGRSHTIVTTASGHLYTFGCNGEYQLGIRDVDQQKTPIQLNSFPPNTEFKMVAAGVDHSVCLMQSGDVYVWGGNSEGQLGTGSTDDEPVPTLLSVGEPIISISVGYYHTALLTRTGSALVFGEVDCGKLGLGNNIKNCRHPQKLSLGDVRIQSIACGGSHTVFLTNEKEVFTCGNGENGQLGHGPSKQQISVPEKLNLPFKVTAICCGENHTALLSDEGYLYTCGDGRHGKLGQGKDNYSNQFEPSRLLKFDPFIVDMVSCGGCHMMVLARHRSVQNGFTHKDIPKLSLDGNQALLENTLELSGSLSARDRRRQTTDSSFSSLNRTLPSLSGKALSSFHNDPNHLHNSIVPTIEVRHLPRLKNSQPCENAAKTNMAEDRSKIESESMILLNKNPEKSSNQNNVQLSEIQKPKVAPRTLRHIEVKNGSLINEKNISGVKEESRCQILDVGKKIEEKENDFQQNIENFNNHSEKNGFSPNLSNGNAISAEIRIIEDQAPLMMLQNKEKKKKKRKKKEEKGNARLKDNDKRKTKESPESKVETVESEESESEELESREVKEAKPKKPLKKLERKKSKKQKENKRKSKGESEEEEEETEEVENQEQKKSKEHKNSPNKKNSKLKEKKKTKEKKEEQAEEDGEDDDDLDDDDDCDDEEIKEVEEDSNTLKEKKTEDNDNDDDKDVETKNGDPIDKLVFAEDLKPKSESQGEDKSKKSHTCNIL